MTTVEHLRLTVIEELVEGQINGTTAASKLNMSIRQVKRLKVKFKEKGHEGLIHGARGRRGVRKTDISMENKIVSIIKEQYRDFGPTLACEKLQAVYGIALSEETIRGIMIRNNLWCPKKRRRSQYFAWRDRRPSYGELQQFDGSYHNWFEGRSPDLSEACLLASIDDATGKITQAVMGVNESVTAVFSFWMEYVKGNGVPKEIYLDKFSTYKINHPAAMDNIELMTQFKRAMDSLGTRLIYAHTPQAKGRVERLFQTLQDRLVKEMRLSHIHTLQEANIFLKDTFIPWYNGRYAVIPKSSEDCHRKLDISTALRLKGIFARQYIRGINNDFTIRYQSNYYQLKEVQPTTVFKTDKVFIEERLDSSIKIRYKTHYLNFFLLPDKPLKAKSTPAILTEHTLNWIPPVNHPWRQRGRIAFEDRQLIGH